MQVERELAVTDLLLDVHGVGVRDNLCPMRTGRRRSHNGLTVALTPDWLTAIAFCCSVADTPPSSLCAVTVVPLTSAVPPAVLGSRAGPMMRAGNANPV